MAELWQPPREAPPPPPVFTGVTLKVQRNCNMGCAECYMYMGDNAPHRTDAESMPMEVVEQVAARIKEHDPPGEVSVAFHGGEPLMLGAEGIKERAEALRNSVPNANFQIQTNGLLLTEEVAGVLKAFNFQVGISLDGGRTANDRHRVDQSGRSTHDRVLKAIGVAKAAKLNWGLLAVVDLANDPVETLETLVAHNPRYLDFLLPLANWDNPPPPPPPGVSLTYGDWLSIAFEKYVQSPTPLPPVKKFRSLIGALLGRPSQTETLGNRPPGRLFVSDDARYGDVDTLQSLGLAAPDLKMNVFDHSFDEVGQHPWMKFRYMGRRALSNTCQRCELVAVCGGGYIPHRFKEGEGRSDPAKFKNTSVYCADLKRWIWRSHKTLLGYMNAPPASERGTDSDR